MTKREVIEITCDGCAKLIDGNVFFLHIDGSDISDRTGIHDFSSLDFCSFKCAELHYNRLLNAREDDI